MKKLTFILALTIILTTLLSLYVSAAPKVGDSIGDVLYSDITAYINGNAIPTSVIKGKTLVVAEDLKKYGFDVVWDGKARTLKVEINMSKAVTPLSVTKDTKNKPGTFKCKYLYTDIKTYISGELVESYAIDGKTLIDFELLKKYGKLTWNGTARTISLTTFTILTATKVPMPSRDKNNTLTWGNKTVDFKDDSGKKVSMSGDITKWFENAKYVRAYTPDPDGWVRGISIDDDGTVLMVENGDKYILVFSVNGKEYEFSLGPGSKIAVEKTKTGYILLPEATAALSPASDAKNKFD